MLILFISVVLVCDRITCLLCVLFVLFVTSAVAQISSDILHCKLSVVVVCITVTGCWKI